MALKRKAQEAFEKPQGHLSAFAAAKLARQSGSSSPRRTAEVHAAPEENSLAIQAAGTPYDGHHSGAVTPNTGSVEDELILQPPRTPSRNPLSTFVPTESNVLKDDEESLEIRLKHHETVTFIGGWQLMNRSLGEYDVTPLGTFGAVEISGTVIEALHGSQRIYATSVSALPQIRCLSAYATIRVSSVRSGLSKLEKLSSLFRNIWNPKSSNNRSFARLSSSDEDTTGRYLYALEINNSIDAMLRTLCLKTDNRTQQPRYMAIGSKSSGKSTLNRLLCNYLRSWTRGGKLLYLDLDPGQPEFGPPGQISLVEIATPILGPPFAHPASSRSKEFRLIRCHTIGATHFKDDPEHYKACARDLIKYVNTTHPTVVNSCGWVSGIGGDVLVDLVPTLKITDFVLLEPLDESLVMSLKRESPNTDFHRSPRRPVKPPSRTPAEARAMQTMSYFHHRADSTMTASRWSGKSINKIRPWIVSYAEDTAGVTAVMSYGPSPSPKYLAEVLDGSIVAVATLDADTASPFLKDVMNQTEASTRHFEDSIDRTPEDIPYIPPNGEDINYKLNPQVSQCIGLALVRSIDIERKELHLVTPLLDSQIAELSGKKVVLVRGSFDSPEWAYLEDLTRDDSRNDGIERPWVSETGMAGIEGSVWRLRHPPVASAAANSR